jgi:hypothetical protein
MLKSKFVPILAGTAAVGLSLFLVAPANAVVVPPSETFNLTSDHCTGGCGTPPFGTVMLTQDGTSVDFVVSLLDSNRFVLTGSADDQYFKFNATGVVVGDITPTQTAPGVTLIADTGAFNGDGTGDFAFGITCTPLKSNTSCAEGGTAALPVGTNIDFTVANSTIGDFLINSGKGNFFVADILSGTTGNTGPVDVPVPAPLIGHGLLVLLAVGGVLSGSKLLENLKKRHLQAV